MLQFKLRVVLFVALSGIATNLVAQELYVATEPASNMPKNSVGVRLSTEIMPGSDVAARFIPEIMLGISKNLMVHSSLYISDVHQKDQRVEGFGFYAKYRILSIDSVQRHFRVAAYGRYSSVKNPLFNNNQVLDDINLEGDNSGIQGGLIITQLLHKLALSASLNYTRGFNNRGGFNFLPGQSRDAISYSFSAGYLTYPKVYTDYKQPNLNIYLEFLGKSNPGKDQSFMDVAPAIQLILNSTTRIDISRRFQLYGNMDRMTKNMYLLRIEHNLFNVL